MPTIRGLSAVLRGAVTFGMAQASLSTSGLTSSLPHVTGSPSMARPCGRSLAFNLKPLTAIAMGYFPLRYDKSNIKIFSLSC
jgi:hypothetical protein